MNEERTKQYNEMVERINAMSKDEVETLVKEDKCPFEPEHMIGLPIGMFHCEVCGEMVVAGLPHPRRSNMNDFIEI